MSDCHDLAVAFDGLAQSVSNEKATVESENLPPTDPNYNNWMWKLASLDTQYDNLSDTAVLLDTAYAQQRLAGLESQLRAISSATNDANAIVAKIEDINDVFHLVASAVAAAAAIAATIANPAVGAASLLASGQALVAAITVYKKANP